MGGSKIAPGTQGNSSDFINQLTRIQLLNSLSESRKVQDTLRSEELEKKLRDIPLQLQQREEEERQRLIEETTGSKETTQTAPFFAESRKLSKLGTIVPKGEITSRDPQTGLPGGAILRPMFATREDIQQSIDRGATGLGRQYARDVADLPIPDEDKKRISEKIFRPGGIVSPSDIVQREVGIRKDLAAATEAEQKAKFAEPEAQARISEKASLEAKQKAEIGEIEERTSQLKSLRGTKEAEAKSELGIKKSQEIVEKNKAEHASVDANYESRKKLADAQEAEFKVSQQTLESNKLKNEIEKSNLEQKKLHQEIDVRTRKDIAIKRLRNAIESNADPVTINRLSQELLAETGGAAGLLSNDRAINLEILDRSEHINKLGTILDQSVSNNSPESLINSEIYNQAVIARAQLTRSKNVTLRTVNPEEGILGAGVNYRVGSSNVPVGIAVMYRDGLLQKIAAGRAAPSDRIYTDTDGIQQVMTPAKALAAYTAITYSYYRGDINRLTEAINRQTADPQTKLEAIRMLPSVSKTETESTVAPPAKIFGAPAFQGGNPEFPTQKQPQSQTQIQPQTKPTEKKLAPLVTPKSSAPPLAPKPPISSSIEEPPQGEIESNAFLSWAGNNGYDPTDEKDLKQAKRLWDRLDPKVKASELKKTRDAIINARSIPRR